MNIFFIFSIDHFHANKLLTLFIEFTQKTANLIDQLINKDEAL